MRYKTLTVDLSDNNPPPDLAKHWAAGFRVLILKLTEGTSYSWAASHALSAAWHKMGTGGIVGHYHFGEPGDGTAEAHWFLAHVLPDLSGGDFLVYDAEKNGVKAKQVYAFIDTCHTFRPTNEVQARMLVRAFRRSMEYGGPGFFIPNRIKSHLGWWLWQAEYGPVAKPIPGFPIRAMWQFTSDATNIPGIGGRVDLSHVTARVLQPTSHFGDRHFAVLDLATALRHAGYRGFAMNSKLGRGKRRAINKLKKSHGWRADGVAGPRVFKALGL